MRRPDLDAVRERVMRLPGASLMLRIVIDMARGNLTDRSMTLAAQAFTSILPVVILAESFLSFLGLGVQEPLTSLGRLIAYGAQDMEVAWWTLIFPGATMMLTLFCFNFVGDGLRDALDPKDR